MITSQQAEQIESTLLTFTKDKEQNTIFLKPAYTADEKKIMIEYVNAIACSKKVAIIDIQEILKQPCA